MGLIWRPGFQFDVDASSYIEAVEAADEIASPGIGALETGVRYAINNFVIGCKQDGIWDAIKASCILAGARTLDGALVPLVGTAPDKYGTEGGWNYNRETGLQGNGTDNYLDSNRSSSASANTNAHIAIFTSFFSGYASNRDFIGAIDGAGSTSRLQTGSSNAASLHSRFINISVTQGSLFGISSTAAATTGRTNRQNISGLAPTNTTTGVSYYVMAHNNNGSPAGFSLSGRALSFYSIGESLDLALLDARVTDLMTAIGAAIP